MLNFIEALFISTFGAPKERERGASAVEYGLLVAGIAAIVVAAVFFLGGIVTEAFTDTCTSIKGTGDTAMTAACE